MNKIEKNPNDCVIYARYSSHSQRDVSIEQQVEECEAFAKYSGLRVVKIYADRHLSGTTDQRPQFQQMLKDAERSGWSVVLTWKVDRFARNRYDSATYKFRLKRYGVKVIYAKEAIPDGPEGILLEAILEGSAEYYSANLAQNVKRGLRFNADKCIFNGGCFPYGYRKGEGGRFEIDETEAAVIREIFARFAGGEKFAHIVDDLDRRCVPTRYGGKWRHNTVRSILSNEVYIGIYHFGDARTEGGVPAIVDAETWKVVKMRLDSAKGTQVRSQRYLFSGRVRCGLCNEPMIGRTAHGRNTTYSYYCCRGHRNKKCVKRDVRKGFLEEAVISRVLEVLNDDDVVGWIADAVVDVQRQEIEKSRTAPSALKAELADVNKAIQGVMSAIEAGIFTPTTKARLEELEAKAEQLKTAIADAELPAPDVSRDFIVYWLTQFRSGAISDDQAVQELVETLVFAVRVWNDRAEAVLNYSGREQVVDVDLGGSTGADGGSPSEHSGWLCCHKANRYTVSVGGGCIVISLPLAA